MISYQFLPELEALEHQELKKELEEGWDVVHFQVNNLSDDNDKVLVTVLLEHTSQNPQKEW